jgi:GT2 family glycosyltransferase
MNVTMVTITYNDEYKLDEWVEKFNGYKLQFYKHIIVDNGSCPTYRNKLADLFPNCEIIYSASNLGCTGAYNLGIERALEDSSVGGVMLLANDLRLSENCIENLTAYLKSVDALGMVSPVWVKPGTKDVIADFGCKFTRHLSMKPYGEGKKLEEIASASRFCDGVGGGTNLATREFYEQVGLQDNNLFMYSDEVDMGLRARKLGILIGVTKNALCWHEHINPPESGNSRPHYVQYLIGRNKVYLSFKHCGYVQQIYIIGVYFFRSIAKLIFNLVLFRKNPAISHCYMIMGSFMGAMNKMDPNRFSQPQIEAYKRDD